MPDLVPILKDPDNEHPIPSPWRETLRAIADAFAQRDYALERGIPGAVTPLPPAEAKRIAGNIEDYGETLASLPDESWATSVCMWQVVRWDTLVDLFSPDGLTDLALFVWVYEDADCPLGYRFEVHSVHVP